MILQLHFLWILPREGAWKARSVCASGPNLSRYFRGSVRCPTRSWRSSSFRGSVRSPRRSSSFRGSVRSPRCSSFSDWMSASVLLRSCPNRSPGRIRPVAFPLPLGLSQLFSVLRPSPRPSPPASVLPEGLYHPDFFSAYSLSPNRSVGHIAGLSCVYRGGV